MKPKRMIKFKATDVEKMIKGLSLLVVSIDRIGSADFDDPKQGDVEMLEYFRTVKAFKMLARMRGVLTEAYDSQSTRADVYRCEESGERLRYWKQK
jgi:hypothetical protein